MPNRLSLLAPYAKSKASKCGTMAVKGSSPLPEPIGVLPTKWKFSGDSLATVSSVSVHFYCCTSTSPLPSSNLSAMPTFTSG